MNHLQNFIVLEGLDGSGTTTQGRLLYQRFVDQGVQVHLTCEPTDLETGKIIRRVLRKDLTVEPATLAYMFAADRYEHIYGKLDGIRDLTENGVTVISDRYFFSSLAYQSLGWDYEKVAGLNSKFPLPSCCIYLDLSPEVCAERMQERHEKDIFEELELQKKVYANYEKAFALYGDEGMKLFRIDGNRPQEEIHKEIWSCVSAANA
ncbi:MAG: dTMP kinase [Spirochaetia bacterium]